MNEILLMASLGIFIAYIMYISMTKGILPSISESYYHLSNKHKILFTLVLWGFSVPIAIVGSSTLIFLAVSAICFVGGAPAFKNDKTEKTVHLVGAYSGIILGLLNMTIEYSYYELAIFTIISMSILLLLNVKNKIWWVEIIAFISIWFSVFYNKIM